MKLQITITEQKISKHKRPFLISNSFNETKARKKNAPNIFVFILTSEPNWIISLLLSGTIMVNVP